MSSGRPIGNPAWISNSLLQAVGAERSKSDGARSVETANGPEKGRHLREQIRVTKWNSFYRLPFLHAGKAASGA